MKVKALANISTKVSKIAGKSSLMIKKKSPEILLAAGLVGFVGTVVLACKATLKADDILDLHEEGMEKIEKTKKMAESINDIVEYTEEDYNRDILVQRVKTIGNMVKLYGPAIALGGVSVACLITSRNITHKRYLAAVSAYNAVSEVFQQYRKRVVDEYGEKLDKHFRYGTTYSTTTENDVDEDGKKIKKKVDVEETKLGEPSGVAVYFDSSNPNWDPNPEFSMMFLKAQQNYLNDRFHQKGHLFLNEALDALGFPHTQQGSLVGWVEGLGDNYIDIGLYDQHKENVRRFVNGNENCILLDFNHDGIIWDKI